MLTISKFAMAKKETLLLYAGAKKGGLRFSEAKNRNNICISSAPAIQSEMGKLERGYL